MFGSSGPVGPLPGSGSFFFSLPTFSCALKKEGGLFLGKKGKKTYKIKTEFFSNFNQIKDEIKKQKEEEVRKRKEARKNARKPISDINNENVTGNNVEPASSGAGVPDPSAVTMSNRQSSDEGIRSNVFNESTDHASEMPNFREYINQEPDSYSEIRVKFFNAEGLKKDPSARAYGCIMEKKYNSYGC